MLLAVIRVKILKTHIEVSLHKELVNFLRNLGTLYFTVVRAHLNMIKGFKTSSEFVSISKRLKAPPLTNVKLRSTAPYQNSKAKLNAHVYFHSRTLCHKRFKTYSLRGHNSLFIAWLISFTNTYHPSWLSRWGCWCRWFGSVDSPFLFLVCLETVDWPHFPRTFRYQLNRQKDPEAVFASGNKN